MKSFDSNLRGLAAHRLAAALSLAFISQAGFAGVDVPQIPQPWVVKNCDDSGVDSLRDIVESKAPTGATVDLSELPSRCDNGGLITLKSEITIAQDDLKLIGPADGQVTISAGHASRVLRHAGSGIVSIESLSIADGRFQDAGPAFGGCIASEIGQVRLVDARVSGCEAISDTGYASGGAIRAYGPVALTRTIVTNSKATSTSASASGGGVYSLQDISSLDSVISDNALEYGAGYTSSGGGLFAGASIVLSGTTVARNSGEYGAAVVVAGGLALIANSTISDNVATGPDAVRLVFVGSATILNSTIAFNTTAASAKSGAISFEGQGAASQLTLRSSIIAKNTAGAANADFFLSKGTIDPNGKDNLVVASNLVMPPPGVITLMTDPKLDPQLAWNGGATPTHRLLAGSPARDVGSNTAALTFDQRGQGYPRTTGPSAKVDMGAVQFDRIFVDGVDP